MTAAGTNETLARTQLDADARELVTTAALVLEQVSIIGQLAGCPPASWSWSSHNRTTS